MRGSGWHHSEETKRKIAESNKRENRSGGNKGCLGYRHSDIAKEKIRASKWVSGRYVEPCGYALVMCRSHPLAKQSGYVYEHRLVAEKALGRYLEPTEVVHHINGMRGDNRNSNLVICQDNSYHLFLHRRMERTP